jgi:hypothetical protein
MSPENRLRGGRLKNCMLLVMLFVMPALHAQPYGAPPKGSGGLAERTVVRLGEIDWCVLDVIRSVDAISGDTSRSMR